MIGAGAALSIMAVAFATSALKEHSLQTTAEHLSRTGIGMITIVRSMWVKRSPNGYIMLVLTEWKRTFPMNNSEKSMH